MKTIEIPIELARTLEHAAIKLYFETGGVYDWQLNAAMDIDKIIRESENNEQN